MDANCDFNDPRVEVSKLMEATDLYDAVRYMNRKDSPVPMYITCAPVAADAASAPPPVPAAVTFHAVINGSQAGPFDMATIKQMIGSNQFSKETLVWKEGMAGWVAASTVNELTSVFGSIPPPLPPQ